MTDKYMRLRSSVSVEEREAEKEKQKNAKLELENMPFIVFRGQIKYYTDFNDSAMICDELLNRAHTVQDLLVIGFDLEWPFSFQTGPGKTAVIQISPTLDECYILHVSNLKKLPKGLAEVLIHPKVRITGVNIKNDIHKLSRDFPGFQTSKILENCVDTGVLANTILPFTQRWSMENLVKYLLKMKINKDNKVRMSKWHIQPLSEEQQIYAATDAYASLLLYHKLKHLEKEKLERELNEQKNIN